MAALMLTAGGMAFAQQPESTEPEKQEVAAPAPESATEESTTQEEKAEEGEAVQLSDLTDEVLEAMPVVKLRSVARSVGLDTMTRKEIRFAKKEELVAAIRAFRGH